MKKAATRSLRPTTARVEPPKTQGSSLEETRDDPEFWSDERCASYAAIDSSRNAAAIVDVFHRFGTDVNSKDVVSHIEAFNAAVRSGNLTVLENMLVSQSIALQTLFTTLTRKASFSTTISQYQTYLGLGLKAQSQSRATIQAIVDLKFPRQVSFVKQANIANGPQQVNNGAAPTALAHEKNAHIPPTKLNQLELNHEHALDAGAPSTPITANSPMEAMAAVHGAANGIGQGKGKPKRIQRRGTRPAAKNRKAAQSAAKVSR